MKVSPNFITHLCYARKLFLPFVWRFVVGWRVQQSTKKQFKFFSTSLQKNKLSVFFPYKTPRILVPSIPQKKSCGHGKSPLQSPLQSP